jgi:WD40 repeat protein
MSRTKMAGLLLLVLLLLDHHASAQGPRSAPAQPRLDSYGDPLPEGAVARLGTTRFRHGQIISGVVFSGDGKSIVASDFYSGVHVWDAAEGKEVRRFFENDYYCHALAISPDGRTLAVALGDLTVRLCDPTSGREVGSLPKDRGRISQMEFSRDGSLLATRSGGKSVKIFNVATRKLLRDVTFSSNVVQVAFMANDKLLAAGTDKGVLLWNLAQGTEVGCLKNDPDGSNYLHVISAPNSGPLAVWGYDDASIRLFDANGEKEIRRFNKEGPSVTKSKDPWGWGSLIFVSFSPNGKVLATGREIGRIDLWDVESGKKLHTLAFDSSQRSSLLAFSTDGTKLASTGSDNWGGTNTIRVWDVARGQEILPLTGHGSPISSVALSPDGNTVATAGLDGIVHLWERTSGKHSFRLEGDRGRHPHVSFSGDGQRVIAWGTWDAGTLRIWDARTGKAVSRFDLGIPEAFWETVSDDGRTAVSVDLKGRRVRFHDLSTGNVTREAPDDAHRPMVLSPAGDKLVASDGALITTLVGKELVNIGRVYWRNPSVKFSVDGRTLVAAVVAPIPFVDVRSEPPAEEITVIDPLEGRHLRRFGKRDEKYSPIDAATLSRDGKTVVTVRESGNRPDEQLITLWETETGKERGHFLGHRGSSSSLAITADGRVVVSGSVDTSAILWDATRPRRLDSSAESPPTDLAARVNALAGDNAERAYASIWALVTAPKETVAFLETQTDLFAATDVEKIQRWIRDLDSDKYADRERASRKLGLILDQVRPLLKKVLQGRPSAEAQRRIDLLLQAGSLGLVDKDLQRYRIIEMLEHIAGPAGDPEASRGAIALLKKLAAGPVDTRLTAEAKAALGRLGRKLGLRC